MSDDVPGKGRSFNARPIVIASAVRLFGQQGYLGTSINDIATDAGVTKGAIFHHFKRKSDLLLEVHESFIEILLARAESRAEAQLQPKEELRALLGDVMWLMDNMMDYVRVFFEDWRHIDPAELVPIKAKRDRYAGHMTEVLRAGVEQGDFRPMDPELTTLFAFGIVNWAYQWYSSSGALDADAIADAMFDLICRGIEAQPPADG